MAALAPGAVAPALAATTAGDSPTVILISLDGTPADAAREPELHAFAEVARRGATATKLVPVFPTNTFPNHVTLVTGVTTPAAKPRIRLKITDGATPTLTWKEPGSPRTNYTVYIFDQRGRVWGATYEWTESPKLSLPGPTFEFPAQWWGLLPKGREYGFKVRRLPDRGSGIWPPNLPESNVVWIWKR